MVKILFNKNFSGGFEICLLVLIWILLVLRSFSEGGVLLIYQKNPAESQVFLVVIPLGLEPRAPTLKVLCSTN